MVSITDYRLAVISPQQQENMSQFYAVPVPKIVAVSFVGKRNEALFFYSTDDVDPAELLNLQMVVYGALDAVAEKRKRPASSTAAGSTSDSLYLGNLYCIDDYKVYGFCSNTHVKTILVVDYTFPESIIKSTINDLNLLYINAIQNPFQPIGQPIVSNSFRLTVSGIVGRSNNAAATVPPKRS